MANKINTAVYSNTSEGYYQLSDIIKEVLSKEILRTALPETVFLQAATHKTDLNTERGLKIEFIKFGALEKGGTLTENIPIPTKNLSTSTIEISVGERGNAVAVSNLLVQAGKVDVLFEAALALGEDAGLVLDSEVRDAFYATTNVMYGGGKDGIASMSSTNALLTYQMLDMMMEKASLLHSRPFVAPNGERYFVLFIHPRHFTQLKRQIGADMERFNRLTYVKDYPAGRPIWRGEVAQVDNIKLVQTPLVKQGIDSNDVWAYDAALAATSALTCIFAGYNGVGYAERQPLSFRENGIEDFGRILKVAWYSIWGAGIVNEESVIKVYTSSNETA